MLQCNMKRVKYLSYLPVHHLVRQILHPQLPRLVALRGKVYSLLEVLNTCDFAQFMRNTWPNQIEKATLGSLIPEICLDLFCAGSL